MAKGQERKVHMDNAEYLGDSQGGGIEPMGACVGCVGCVGCGLCTACAGCASNQQRAYWVNSAVAINFVGFGLW